MNELLREVLAEGVETLAALDVELARLERDPHDATAFAGAFRQLHTIKGTSACVRLGRVARLAHAAEDALAALRIEGSPATGRAVAGLRLAAQRVRQVMLELATTGHEPAGDDTDVLAALSAAVPGAPAEGAADAAPEPQAADHLGSLVRDLAGIRDRLLAVPGVAWTRSGGELRRLNDVVSGLQRVAPRLRWRPLGSALEGLGGMVADLAADLGKRAELVVEGADLDVDPRILAKLRCSLIHLLRNAVDHGIEAPRDRLQAGKPLVGRLAVSAGLDGDTLVVRVSDDGRGVDVAALRRRIVSAGHAGDAEAASMPDEAVRALAFRSGVSCLEAPTAVSGRGVGLDAVRSGLAEIAGTADIEPAAGCGTAIALRIPLVRDDRPQARKVLVVDDGPFSRRVLTPLLAAVGCRVVAVEDAARARQLMDTEGERFDLVVGAGSDWSPAAAPVAERQALAR